MKFMSLNVNRFSGMKERDFTDSFDRLEDCPKANEIIGYATKFLNKNAGGIVLLQEVPYMESPLWKGKKRELFKAFEKSLMSAGCKIIPPKGKGKICTLAIVKENNIGKRITDLFSNDYANKLVEIEYENVCILGIHAPDDMEFLDSLKKYAEKKALVIIGDFNIATNEWRLKEIESDVERGKKDIRYLEEFIECRKWILEKMPAAGYFDVMEKEIPTYFKMGTTIDHVLVPKELRDKVTAWAEPRENLELSDHAVIIGEIKA